MKAIGVKYSKMMTMVIVIMREFPLAIEIHNIQLQIEIMRTLEIEHLLDMREEVSACPLQNSKNLKLGKLC